jgi:predicted CopG family antitoxin
MSPKEIMDRLMKAVIDGWTNDMKNSSLTTWDFAAETISELHLWENRNEDSVVDLLAYFAHDATGDLAMSKEEFAQLWSKLTKEQKEAFLKDLYHSVATYGLIDFLNHVNGNLKLNEVKAYLSGVISFSDLIDRLTKKYIDNGSRREAESAHAGVELANYVSDKELKDLVRKYVLPQLIKRK